ncbi:hypothetical protein [Actinoplanes sp. NPDC026670]|uniref:hypothetical protein n=1 Tax=Actinoplanes sp. NPDC026670 TaxID=3154700 RepID=UPI00340607AE
MARGGRLHRHGLACVAWASLAGAAVGSYVALRQCRRSPVPQPDPVVEGPDENRPESTPEPPEAPVVPERGLFQELLPFLLGAVPVLVPLVAIGLFADSAVAAAVLWQGGLSALFLAMVPSLLPMVAGGSILVMRHVLGGPAWWRKVALTVTLLLLTVVPMSFAIVQAIVVSATGMTSIRRRLAKAPAVLQGGAVVCGTVVLIVVCAGAWPGLQTAAIGRIIAGIPAEMIVYNDSMVRQPARVHVIQVDEQFTTVLDGNPPHVVTIPNRLISVRVACQYPRTEWNHRSVIEIVRDLLSDGPPATMVCGR